MKRSKPNSAHWPRGITRRDFLNSTLIGAGAALIGGGPGRVFAGVAGMGDSGLLPPPALGADWYGYGGVGDYAASHGNTPEVLARAHALRDGLYDWSSPEVIDTGETYDMVIVGAGLTGLSAAQRFRQIRQPGEKLLVLDNHPVFGGEAKRNEFLIDGYRILAPQGSNGFTVPEGNDPTAQVARYFFEELGIPTEFDYPNPPNDLEELRFLSDDYAFLWSKEDDVSMGYFFDEQSHGVPARWVKNPWANGLEELPISDTLRAQFLQWRNGGGNPYQGQNPMQWLDSMSYQDLVVRELGLPQEVAEFADPILASGNGGCSSVLSAFSAFMVGMPGVPGLPQQFEFENRHSFPGGNDGFSRSFLRSVMPEAIEGEAGFDGTIDGHIRFDLLDVEGNPFRVRLSSSVIRVEHEGDPQESDCVRIMYVRDSRLHVVRARSVVMATGSWINKYVVSDLPATHRQAMSQFHHTSVLVANVGIRHWRFVKDLGITAFRWWDDFGFATILKQPMYVGDYQPPFDPDKPAVLSFYVPLYYPGKSVREQGILGRTELYNTSFAEYEGRIRRVLDRLFGNHGFNSQRDIAGIILNRWGHAYTCPPPGFFFGVDGNPPISDVVRQPFGRIAFAHSELWGGQFWRGAATEGRRAADQMREVL